MLMFIINIVNLIVVNLEIGTLKLVLEGKPLNQKHIEGFPRISLVS
jgi:hypothetical protein